MPKDRYAKAVEDASKRTDRFECGSVMKRAAASAPVEWARNA
jgi:hypothetical protein